MDRWGRNTPVEDTRVTHGSVGRVKGRPEVVVGTSGPGAVVLLGKRYDQGNVEVGE